MNTSQAEKDLLEVLKTETGRRFVSWILFDQTKVDGGVYSDGERIRFNEGRRSVGVELAQAIQHLAPHRYSTMIQERMTALAREKESKDAERRDD